VLIMEDFSRLTRAGDEAHHQIEAEFAKYGVRIVYVARAQHGDIRRDLRRLLKRIRSS
jgi:DNA invertase Pin-like site-specific DNA recombinase